MWSCVFSTSAEAKSEMDIFPTWIQSLRFPYYTTIITYSVCRVFSLTEINGGREELQDLSETAL